MRLLWPIVFLAGCYNPSFGGGKLQCATGGKCPDGYFCAADNKCYKNGTPPPPGATADMATVQASSSGNHQGTSVMAGAVTARSARYKVIMSTGQSPGGNGTAASQQQKVRGGLVGATQNTQ